MEPESLTGLPRADGLRLRFLLRLAVPASEHAEHPVGDHEATDDVDRAEGDGDHADHLLQGVIGRADDYQAAEHDDAVDRVGLRHQRRVQSRRHLGDDLEADEGGEDEDRDLDHQAHDAASLALSLTISPSLVSREPAMTSSSVSTLRLPSSSIRSSTRF